MKTHFSVKLLSFYKNISKKFIQTSFGCWHQQRSSSLQQCTRSRRSQPERDRRLFGGRRWPACIFPSCWPTRRRLVRTRWWSNRAGGGRGPGLSSRVGRCRRESVRTQPLSRPPPKLSLKCTCWVWWTKKLFFTVTREIFKVMFKRNKP